MSQIDQKGEVSIFQKCLKFKNVSNVGGGGGNPNSDIVRNFTVFFSDASPKKQRKREILKHTESQYIKESDTHAKFAAIKQFKRKV